MNEPCTGGVPQNQELLVLELLKVFFKKNSRRKEKLPHQKRRNSITKNFE